MPRSSSARKIGILLGGSALLAAVLGGVVSSCGDECSEDDAMDLFARRIQPLLDADNPTSCAQCHAAGVGLAMYARADACTTMACMVDRGVVSLDDPDTSLVLDWIARATPESELITQDTIAREHDAVRDWIDYNARCGARVCPDAIEAPCGKAAAASDCEMPPSASHDLPPMPWDDPGDCSDRTLELMFQAKVYSWRGRCSPCHFTDWPAGRDDDAPRWISVGPCDVASVQTMHTVLDRGLVDLASPGDSLLLLKPLAEDAGGVEHGGGHKFKSVDEGAYQDFRAWVDRVAQCHAG